MASTRFSTRHGLSPSQPDKFEYETAPNELRLAAIQFAADLGVPADFIRAKLLDIINAPREPQFWTDPRYVVEETQRQISKAEWFEVYDFIEAIARWFMANGMTVGERYESKLNRFFERHGIGWQLRGTRIEARGPEAFEAVVAQARMIIDGHGLQTAHRELHEALLDLSRRPQPDVTGAVQHAAAALECVAREVTADPKATLGEILSRYPAVLPPVLSQALAKLWGFASETARHIREGRTPGRGEAQLVVGICAVVAEFLLANRQQ